MPPQQNHEKPKVTPTSINAQIVSDIPVKSPLGVSPAKPQPEKSPVAKIFQPSSLPKSNAEEKVLEHILKDVNKTVKKAEHAVAAKPGQKRPNSAPIAATAIACLVALMLTAAAFYVYRNGY